MSRLDAYHPLLGHGDFADVYMEESSSLAIRWEEEKVESVAASDDSGVGIRYLIGDQTRFGHLDMARPIQAPGEADVDKLMHLRKELAGDLPLALVRPVRPPSLSAHAVLKPPAFVSLDEKVALLRRAFQAAQSGPHLRQINVNYGEKLKRVAYVNSLGDAFIEKRTYVVMSITVTVERNRDLQTGYESFGGMGGVERIEDAGIERLAAMVAARAHAKLNAPPAPVGEMPVVIAASAGGTLIHEAIGHSLEADAVLEGTSPAYQGKLGHIVANEKLTVFDNPTVPGARGSFHFDDEGVASEATVLIQNGVLTNYLFDRLSARKAGRSSNGHGRRESYAHKPIPRMSNTYIAPGPDDPDQIVESLRDGLLVTKMGGGQVNTANGDFVFEVEEGYQIRNGQRQLVRGATLLGNGPETLRRIDMVGRDHGWGIGTCGKEGQGVPVSDAIPTIRIQKLLVGGQT